MAHRPPIRAAARPLRAPIRAPVATGALFAGVTAKRPAQAWRAGLPMLAVVLLGGCGTHSAALPGPARSSIAAATGSYGGVRLGSALASPARHLGPPLRTNNTTFLNPSVQPPFLPADNPYDIVYADVRFTTVARRVASISVYGRGAGDDNGVRVGEPLGQVRLTLPGATCVGRRGGLDPEQPGCQIHPAPGVYEYFSGDPVAVISLSVRAIVP